MRILFVARHFTYFRSYDAALRELAARGHQIHLAVERSESMGGEQAVHALAREYPSITYGTVPPRREDAASNLSRRLRLGLGYLRYLDPFYDDAPLLRVRARERTPRALIRLADPPLVGGAWWRRRVASWLHALDAAAPVPTDIVDYLRGQRPDALVITPLVDLGSQQIDFVRAARSLGIPSALAVWSWDNLSSKAYIRDCPELVFVWNDTQRREAIKWHGVPPDRVVVTGAQCFDHWFDRRPSRSRQEFCDQLGLPADRPLLLYVCSGLIKGSPPEPPFVREWLARIRASADPDVAGAGVLVRPHPAQTHFWNGIDLSDLGPVALWGGNPIDSQSRADYFDSLYHSAAVVGLNTSAFIEAGIVGREVLTILPPQFHNNQMGTLHFRYLMEIGGGLLRVSRDFDTHLAQISAALARPAVEEHPHKAFVESFVRPGGLDVPATPAFVAAVERLAQRTIAAGAAVRRAPSRWRQALVARLGELAASPRASTLLLSPRELAVVERGRAADATQAQQRLAEKRRRADEAREAKEAKRAEQARRKAERRREWVKTVGRSRGDVVSPAADDRTAMNGAVAVATEGADVPATGRLWRRLSYGYALLVAAALIYFVLGIPVPFWDVLGDLLDPTDQSVSGVVVREMTGTQFIRPLARVPAKLASELFGGAHYFVLFKAFHVAQIVALALLFVRLLRVRSRTDALVVPFGLALLFGTHTLLGHTGEAFPLNNYLTAVIACLAAADLALSPYAWWRGPAAILVFAFAALTIESGLLVWVCLVAAWIAGGRGVSWRTLSVATCLLGLYVVLRLTLLQTATPLLTERPSGFGFHVLEPSEIDARFGDSRGVVYAYNVASQILTVLFSEPRAGVWAFARDFAAGKARPGQWIALLTSTGATLMIGWYVATRLGRWLRREFNHADRVVFVAGAVLIANAVISFTYLEDAIVGPAAAFHALAAALALRALLRRLSALRPQLVVAASVAVVMVSAGSVVRLVGTCFLLRERAFVTRNDWARFEDEWAVRHRFDVKTADPRKIALVRRLRDDAIGHRTPAPHFTQGRSDYWFR